MAAGNGGVPVMQVLGGGSGTGAGFPCHVCFCECASETSRVAPLETCPDCVFFLFPVVQFSEDSAFSSVVAYACAARALGRGRVSKSRHALSYSFDYCPCVVRVVHVVQTWQD